jgi:hypothetical protein
LGTRTKLKWDRRERGERQKNESKARKKERAGVKSVAKSVEAWTWFGSPLYYMLLEYSMAFLSW